MSVRGVLFIMKEEKNLKEKKRKVRKRQKVIEIKYSIHRVLAKQSKAWTGQYLVKWAKVIRERMNQTIISISC